MAIAATRQAPQPLQQRAVITAGGLLWRRARSGRIEVCLALSPGGFANSFTIPRGIIQEDERVADAAVRRVHESTGLQGRAPRKLGRLTFSSGEIAYVHLLRAPRTGSASNAAWVPVEAAARLVETDGEREVLVRVAAMFAVLTEMPESGRAVVVEPMAARRATTSASAAPKRSRVPASAA